MRKQKQQLFRNREYMDTNIIGCKAKYKIDIYLILKIISKEAKAEPRSYFFEC